MHNRELNALQFKHITISHHENATPFYTVKYGAILGSATITNSAWSTKNSNLSITGKTATTTTTSAKFAASHPGTYTAVNTVTDSDGEVIQRKITFVYKAATYEPQYVYSGTPSTPTNLDLPWISIEEFGAIEGVGNSAVNDVAYADAAAWLALQTEAKAIVWPAGVWEISDCPSFAVTDYTQLLAIGVVRWRYVGTGNAFILDGGATGPGILNITVGPFLIEAPSTANDGVYMRAVHHSRIALNVRGCGAAGFRMIWCVANEMRAICSVNQGGWYSASAPPKGLVLESRATSEQCSYNLFSNCLMEGPPIGAEFTGALGNIFQGGAFEGCATHGLDITSSAENFANRFYGTDFEKNGGSPSYPGPDVICDSRDNEFHGIDTFRDFVFGANAVNNKMIGGSHRDITLTAGAASNIITNITIDRFGNTPAGSIIGDTDANIVRDITDNAGTLITEVGLTLNPATFPAKVTITVGASPYLYTNTSEVSESVCVSTDQPITKVTYGRAGSGEDISTTHGMWVLAPGDQLLVTYPGTAPSMFSWSFAR